MDETTKELAKSLSRSLENVTDIFQKLAGPFAEEAGILFGDYARVYRLRQEIKLLEKVRQMLADAGIEPKNVHPRVLAPLLNYATLEDDEDLHTRWAALLANAASCQSQTDALPAFVEVLRQTTPVEALFMDRAYDAVARAEEQKQNEINRDYAHLDKRPKAECCIPPSVLTSTSPIMISDLERLGLLVRFGDVPFLAYENQIVNQFSASNHIYISVFGRAFVSACRPPSGG